MGVLGSLLNFTVIRNSSRKILLVALRKLLRLDSVISIYLYQISFFELSSKYLQKIFYLSLNIYQLDQYCVKITIDDF